MRIYTKKGDKGETSLPSGERVPKESGRIAACGNIDELNAAIGAVASVEPTDFQATLLEGIQRDLLSIGAKIANPELDDSNSAPDKITATEKRISDLENAIDAATEEMPPLSSFLLPGGVHKAALLHQARTVCRRAERRVVALSRMEPLPSGVLSYLNRLSDLLFTLARLANFRAGEPDRKW